MNAITKDVDAVAIAAIGDVKEEFLEMVSDALSTFDRPSVIYRPILSRTPQGWKLAYGEFVAFGETPARVMAAFDAEWTTRSGRR